MDSPPSLPDFSLNPKPGKRKLKKFDPQLGAEIVTAIRAGLSPDHAAHLNGVDRETFALWLKKKPDFALDCQRGQAQDVAYLLGQITLASSKYWRAAAWKLERLYPKWFGVKREITAKVESSSHLGLAACEEITQSWREFEAWQNGKKKIDLNK